MDQHWQIIVVEPTPCLYPHIVGTAFRGRRLEPDRRILHLFRCGSAVVSKIVNL